MKYLKLMITAELLMMGGSAFATAEDSLRCDTLHNVIVVANRKYNYAGKAVYTFTDKQIKQSRHSLDLMENVKNLRIDTEKGKLVNMKGEEVKILVNGVGASENDLKSIQADKIKRVEHYDIPPARYAEYRDVVNIVTRKLDNGYNGGFDYATAFTTGFMNGNAFFRYVNGLSQLAMDYSMNYRAYDKHYSTNDYTYLFEDDRAEYSYFSKNSMGYRNHDINLKYAYVKPENFTFQAAFNMAIMPNYYRGDEDIKEMAAEGINHFKGLNTNDSRYYAPSLDLYFSKQISKRQELSLDVVGTWSYAKQMNVDNERSAENDATIVDDLMRQHIHKQSVIAEAVYTAKLSGSAINLGYKANLTRSNSDIANLSTERHDYNSDLTYHYLYGEWSGAYRQLSYRLSVGGKYLKTDNDVVSYHKWLFSPKVVLMQRLGKGFSLQYQLSAAPSAPSISQLTDNYVHTTSKLLRVGNPYLKTGVGITNDLRLDYMNKYVDISLSATHSNVSDKIARAYEPITMDGNKYVCSKFVNYDYYREYGGTMNIMAHLFNKSLDIIAYTEFLKQEARTYGGEKYSHWYLPVYLGLRYRNGNWGASYIYSIPGKKLSGMSLYDDENNSHLDVYYQRKNIRVGAACYWLFTKAKYPSETIPNNVLINRGNTYIDNNRSMITLNFSWNFSKGKNLSVDKKISNSDSSTGLF